MQLLNTTRFTCMINTNFPKTYNLIGLCTHKTAMLSRAKESYESVTRLCDRNEIGPGTTVWVYVLVSSLAVSHEQTVYIIVNLCTLDLIPSLEESGSVQEATFQQPQSDKCTISSQGLNEDVDLCPPIKRQKLNTSLSSMPQESHMATTPGELRIVPVHVPTDSHSLTSFLRLPTESHSMATSEVKPQQKDVSNTQRTNSASQIFRQYYADMVKAIQVPSNYEKPKAQETI